MTLNDYAKKTNLPRQFLEKLGLREENNVLVTPYFAFNGNLFRERFRRGGDFWWDAGQDSLPYGLWRLNGDNGLYITFCEGESDAQTLWFHDIRTLGIPGAQTFKPEWIRYFRSYPEIFLVEENDQGGEKFLEKMVEKLREGEYKGEVRVIRLPQDCKDVNDLFRYSKSSERFKAVFAGLVAEATEVKLNLPNLATLLGAVENSYRKYIVFQSESQSVAVVLWTASTHIFPQFEQSPYLNISSPVMRCGKTRLLDVAERLTARPWRVVTPTEAVLFRKIERDQPTLLLDEVDIVFRGRKGEFEGVRALLNAGNRKDTMIPRCIGAKFEEIRDFSIFCPKAFAGIGDKLPSTVKDRSIAINLARKKPDEEISRFRQREASQVLEPLRTQLDEWAKSADLSEARPEMPEGLDDRAEDCWEPLFAIADLAGGDWPKWARRAALELSAGRFEDESLGTKLLQDIKGIFDDKKVDRLGSDELIQSLVGLEEAPWGDWFGKELTARSMARLLKPYGVEPRTHRFSEETARGYLRTDFVDSWGRYLPPKVPES